MPAFNALRLLACTEDFISSPALLPMFLKKWHWRSLKEVSQGSGQQQKLRYSVSVITCDLRRVSTLRFEA